MQLEETVNEYKKELTVDDVTNQLRRGKKLHDEVADAIRQKYLVNGKLMSEWRQHFKIHIPNDINLAICQGIGSRLMDLFDEASSYKADAEARLKAIENATSAKHRDSFTSIIAQHKANGQKLPASATLNLMAETSVAELKESAVHAEIELAFWKEILGKLYHARKLLEDSLWNLNIEARALHMNRGVNSYNADEGVSND